MDNEQVRGLPIPINENLLSAWNAVASGALQQSRSGDVICNIVVGDDYTRIAICQDGFVVDTAAFALGGQTLQIDDKGILTEISESGETFLDAVAKKIGPGDFVEEELVGTLSNLVGETIVNLLVRKRPPQISMRLLESEPLVTFYTPYQFRLSCVARSSRMSRLIMASIKDSIAERNLTCTASTCHQDDRLVSGRQSTYLAIVGSRATVEMVPVLWLPSKSEAQLDERMRRHSLSRSSPYVVLTKGELVLHEQDNSRTIAQVSAKPPFFGNWYLKSHDNEIELVEILIARSESAPTP